MLNDAFMRQIDIQSKDDRANLICFLSQHALRFEEDIDVAFGLYSFDDTLVGCGCAAGALLKCFAVSELLRGQNALGTLMAALVQDRFAHGFYSIMVITRACNERQFSSCGFYPVVRTSTLVMLENCRNGPALFAQGLLREEDRCKEAGAIVMNANPFTLGHRHLVEYAAAHCDILHIFVVEENRSLFPTAVRYQLVQRGTSDLTNVRVHLSGHYILSTATFPTYFLKSNEDATALQAELDVTLFAESIAPILHIAKRFVGAEPLDPVTAQYNKAMRDILPAHDIAFVEIPRYSKNGQLISASLVREGMRSREAFDDIADMLPEDTRRYIESGMLP